MGIFSRFTDIVNSNINAILDKAENPEKIVRLMIQEMEDTLVEVRSAAARSIADRKETSRSHKALQRDVDDWQSKAELAIDKGRDDLAKAALAEKARVVKAVEGLDVTLAALDEGLEKLNTDISRLESKLSDAKARQQAILARHEAASRRLEVRKKIHDPRIDDALVRFEGFERRIDGIEGRVEAYDLGGKKDLAHEFAGLEAEDEIEQELEALKSKRAKRPAEETTAG
ncbi:MAG TPA: phage shock protein PspA [Gammaproteobacteria bacterium]